MESPPENDTQAIPTITSTNPVSSTISSYIRWNLHTQVTLEAKGDLIQHPPIPDPPYIFPYGRHQPRRHAQMPSTTTNSSGKITITMYIERIVTRNVAILLDCHNPDNPARWVGKFCRLGGWGPYHLAKETLAYNKCKDVQGAEIPFFYGEWIIYGTPANACSMLLMEFIYPGTTVSSIRDAYHLLSDEEKRWARDRLAFLHSWGTRAVDKINECGVAHDNLCGQNMILYHEVGKPWIQRVVLVGFSSSTNYDGLQMQKLSEDLYTFHRSFMVS